MTSRGESGVGRPDNPLFADPIFQKCMELAGSSLCQKLGYGAVMVCGNEIVADSSNKPIAELASLCEPTCIRFKIQSRTESMLGACGHAEEWVLQQTRDKGIDPAECDMYIAGNRQSGEPHIKSIPEHTCLRCTVAMHRDHVRTVLVPVVDRWMPLTTAEALETAKAYALGEKKVE
jgi:deoxycytidylate deaminase